MKDDRISAKLKKASQLLFFRRHNIPGMKGWELKKKLGKDYLEIIKILNDELDKIGMEVKIVGQGKMEESRFFVTMKDSAIEKASGWRVDDVAMLAATIAYIISKEGKAPRKDIEAILKEKFLAWKVNSGLDRFIRLGYLGEDGDLIYMGWRTRAEIDQKALLDLILSE